jgi:hypothetical protein
VRGLIFSVLGVLAAGAWLYQRLTNDAAVKEQVIANFEAHFLASHVSVGSAGLRLLGGISFSELRLARSNDLENTDLLYVPSGIIYHDKEQLLDGKLAIRKLEFQRPRIRVIRNADGTWNTSNFVGQVDLEQTIPTVVIRHGTIVLEDRLAAPDAAPIEIKDVNLTLVNDPAATLAIHLQGNSDLIGNLVVQALWQRATLGLELTLEAPAVPVGASLVQRLGAYCRTLGEHARQLEGLAHFQAKLTFDPEAERPWSHWLSCTLTQGKLRHPQVPLPLEQIEAELCCSDEDGLYVKKVTAQAGAALLELEGSARECRPDADFEGKLKVTQLPVHAELFTRLPENLRRFQETYAPVGTANLEMEVARAAGLWRRHCVITAGDSKARFVGFPYPLEHIRGRLEEHIDEAKHIHDRSFDLVGAGSESRPVHLKGTVTGEGPNPEIHIDLWGEDLPVDETLLAALPQKEQKVARSFHPRGKGNYVVQLRRQRGQEKFANHITFRLHDATALYDVFPYPLENVSGVLEIFPDHFEFRDFRGMHKGGEFRTWGGSASGSPERVGVNIRGSNILLDSELEAALAPKLRVAWKALVPGGRMNLEAYIDQLPDRPEDIAVRVTAQGCTLRPAFFPYLLTDVRGTVRYARGKVDLEKISCRHEGTVIELDQAQIFLKPVGGFWARLQNLRGQPVVCDADLQAALPPMLKKICAIARPGTPVGLAAEVVIDMPAEPNLPPDIYWDGGISVQDATLDAGIPLEQVRGQFWCQGRFDGRQLRGIKGNVLLDQAVLLRQPFRAIHSHVVVNPEAPGVLRMPDFQARFMGGDVGGELRVEFGPTLHYNVNLSALQIQLEEFGRHNFGPQSQWQGMASARIYLSGHGNDIHGLEGHGSIDVPSGKMYNLPLFLDLIKMLELRPPDRTAFEEAHADFTIKGPRVVVNRLDLDGNAISLSALPDGGMNLDGSDVQLDFYAVWGRIKQVLPPIFREIPPALGQQLLKIKMRGRLNDVRITKEWVPVLVEPLEKFQQRVTGRSSAPPKPAASELDFGNNQRPAFFGVGIPSEK